MPWPGTTEMKRKGDNIGPGKDDEVIDERQFPFTQNPLAGIPHYSKLPNDKGSQDSQQHPKADFVNATQDRGKQISVGLKADIRKNYYYPPPLRKCVIELHEEKYHSYD
ncbi:unnamed protein product [Ilex paraguariensis]|uniref:Uncharacterized protein n=1 Tax=Ilex paraguariensis TaxID=185542 RepID=A0ABC8V0H8_9AQUA